jgi:hypothetical protein
MRVRTVIPTLLLIACHVFAQSDATIPLRIQQPQFTNPMDALVRAQQLRRLQLENEARQQQIQQQNQGQQQAAAPSQPAPLTQKPVTDDQRTLGFVNGRLWNGSNIDMKLSYIVGIAEAVSLTSGDVFRYFGRNLNAAENAKAVDRFYEDPGNLPVPVSFALQIVAMKANGEKPEAVETFTASVKRAIIDAQPAQKP